MSHCHDVPSGEISKKSIEVDSQAGLEAANFFLFPLNLVIYFNGTDKLLQLKSNATVFIARHQADANFFRSFLLEDECLAASHLQRPNQLAG